MVGPSGTGKSTKAKEISEALRLEGVRSIIVNRDKLREMVFGYTEESISLYYKHDDLKFREYEINEVQDTVIKQALAEGKVVIIDNTHLRESYIKDLTKYNVPVKCEVMMTSKEEALRRDAQRVRSVGGVVINKQYAQLASLKGSFDFKVDEKLSHIEQNMENDHAMIFDIDGTLAHMNGRSPYDMSKVGEDTLDYPVWAAYKQAQNRGNKIIICTGREGTEECIKDTMQWLADNDITYDHICFRPEGSYEKDWKIKEAMWKAISHTYYIVAMYDDRNQVVSHARNLGLKVFQVAEGNF